MAAHPPLTPFGSALAGALGAVFSNAAVYPLDTVKTRLQALPPSERQSITPNGKARAPRGLVGHLGSRLRRWEMLNMLIRIIKVEGIRGTFKGFSANMINTFSMQFAYFFFHTLLRKTAIKRLSGPSPSLSTSSELLLGAIAGGLAQIFTIPVSVIATRQQLWTPPLTASTAKVNTIAEPSLLDTAREIIAEGGPTALWTGLKPGLVLTVNPAITYGLFERLKSRALASSGRTKLTVGESFWIGVGSKTVATVVTYPYIFAKVRLQAKPKSKATPAASTEKSEGGQTYADVAAAPAAPDAPVAAAFADEAPHPKTPRQAQNLGAIGILKQVYKEQGVLGWYQGLGAQIVKAVLCQGILFVSKDQFEVYALAILMLFSRIQARLVPGSLVAAAKS